MVMVNWYLAVLKNYAGFTERAGRAEFWYFVLMNIIVSLLLAFIDGALGTAVIGIIYMLAVFVPNIALAVRRLHDIGKSGWWLLVGFVPVVGIFVLLYFYIKEGDAEANAFGAVPAKQPAA